MQKILHKALLISTFCLVFNISAHAQNTGSGTGETSEEAVGQESAKPVERPDTLVIGQDTLVPITGDTLIDFSQDTLAPEGTQGGGEQLDSEVEYNAADSIVFGMDSEKVFLYKNATVKYQNNELTADYIEFDMGKNEVFATGLPDSAGIIAGKPVFKDGSQELNAERLRYNFKTQKGYIEAVRTQQEGGYLLAEKTKMDEVGHVHMKNGKYTTCDAEHPHYYIALTKAKSIPGDKIVSGPAYFVIEDIIIPIGIPFGFFPNTKTNSSGILIPQYGEEANRGFYLRNGGYYLAINDYMDLRLTGDIYTNGTWGLRAGSQYRVRYRFNGSVNARIYQNVSGEKGLDNYSVSSDYAIMWSHNQDAKANPTQNFRASVNLSTRRFDENHSRVLTNALTNTKQSSISYQKRWNRFPFNLSASANHSQNSNTGAVDLNLPKVSFNMTKPLFPFRSQQSTGRKKLWEDIQIGYSSFLDNRIRTVDTLLFTSEVWNDMSNGFRHEIPISWNIKPSFMRTLNITPNLRYRGMLYTEYTQKYLVPSVSDPAKDSVVTETINGLRYAHSYYPSISTSLTPRIYGMYIFKENSRVEAIRHVIAPTVSFSYVPDMSNYIPDYYAELRDEEGNLVQEYSIFENGIFGTPSINGSSKTMSIGLNNNVEAKIRQFNDTTGIAEESKKIKILDNFNFRTSVDFDDSIKFTPIAFNGNTRFLDGKINITFRGTMDPYALDSTGRKYNFAEFRKTGKLARITNAGLSVGMNFRGGSGSGGASPASTPDQVGSLPTGTEGPMSNEYDTFDEDYYGEYVDFNIPWSLRIDYSLNYSKPTFTASIVQTVRFTGDFSLTPKWKIGFNTGYDFKRAKITTSNLSVYRDLHCWEMRLTAVPFGRYKSFNFQINVKSAILQDLKYNKRIPWQDNF